MLGSIDLLTFINPLLLSSWKGFRFLYLSAITISAAMFELSWLY